MYALTVGRRHPGGSITSFSPIPTNPQDVGCIMRTCIIPECKNKHHAKGYCNVHYLRVWKYGNPFIVKSERHGLEHTSEYRTWYHMKGRCYCKSDKKYYCYGERGITVCDQWFHSFTTFLEDMGVKPFSKAQIDRIDNDGNYEPDNCRWATSLQNNRNRSWIKLTMQKAEEIREIYKKGNTTHKNLALDFQIGQTNIWRIVNNKIWKETA